MLKYIFEYASTIKDKECMCICNKIANDYYEGDNGLREIIVAAIVYFEMRDAAFNYILYYIYDIILKKLILIHFYFIFLFFYFCFVYISNLLFL